ncbi:three-helix bundle dimerization domain-containing protein [Kribbella lupini]|uniref:three-helix bundle dimerization domain-containing protein n=1 Tax=Kribbella lupini TaxID=291602 RepID=UPI003CD0ADAB
MVSALTYKRCWWRPPKPVDRLARQFPDVPTESVAAVVQDAQPAFEQAPIRDFVPLFVERTAKQHLRQAAG